MLNFQKKKGKIYIEFSIEFQVKLDINNVKFQSKGILLHVLFSYII